VWIDQRLPGQGPHAGHRLHDAAIPHRADEIGHLPAEADRSIGDLLAQPEQRTHELLALLPVGSLRRPPRLGGVEQLGVQVHWSVHPEPARRGVLLLEVEKLPPRADQHRSLSPGLG